MSHTLQRPRAMSLPVLHSANAMRHKPVAAANAVPPVPEPASQPENSDRVTPPPPLSRKLRTILRERLTRGELNLCKLSTDESFTVSEWQELQRAAATPVKVSPPQLQSAAAPGLDTIDDDELEGGAGIIYVECEADMLPGLLEGIEQLPNLDCLSVWAPADGGAVDFGTLGQKRPCRTKILGTPNAPLEVTAWEGLAVEGQAATCKAIQQSVVKRRLADGSVSCESSPLPVARLFEPAVLPLPRLADTPLLATLTSMLRTIASPAKFAADPFDPAAVAKALLDCAAFDEQGDFGFDLKKLTSQQVGCIQALPAAAWNEVQNEVEEAGWLVTWLDIHEDFALGALARALQPLSPLSRITVSAPKGRGFFIDLAGLHGPELANWHSKYAAFSQLQEVAVRPRTDKQFVISVPHSLHGDPVKVVLAKDAQATSAQLQKSSILRVDIEGRTVGQAERFLAS